MVELLKGLEFSVQVVGRDFLQPRGLNLLGLFRGVDFLEMDCGSALLEGVLPQLVRLGVKVQYCGVAFGVLFSDRLQVLLQEGVFVAQVIPELKL